jgi:6-phosphogluconate dehydrogenase (decarboxylating)
MELGMVGLGRMGGNMAQRLLTGGHRIVAFDPQREAVQAAEGPRCHRCGISRRPCIEAHRSEGGLGYGS